MAFNYDPGTNKITCPRNNNGTLEVNVTGMTFEPGDVLAFYIRDPARAKKLREIVLHPGEEGKCMFTLNSGDTELIPPGKYKWNLRIVTAPQFDEDGNLTIAEDSANSITVFNRPPDFEVLEV